MKKIIAIAALFSCAILTQDASAEEKYNVVWSFEVQTSFGTGHYLDTNPMTQGILAYYGPAWKCERNYIHTKDGIISGFTCTSKYGDTNGNIFVMAQCNLEHNQDSSRVILAHGKDVVQIKASCMSVAPVEAPKSEPSKDTGPSVHL